MAETRDKFASILLKIDAKRTVELYDAEVWPNVPAARPGLYRVRLDGRWYAPSGVDYEFFSPVAVMKLLARLVFSAAPEPEQCPHLPEKTRVNAPIGRDLMEGVRAMLQTHTKTRPFLDFDGVWKVFVLGCPEPLPVADVRIWAPKPLPGATRGQ